MDPRSEANVMIGIVTAMAPWVWPATAAILVAGLVVVSSLIGAPTPSAASDAATTVRQRTSMTTGLTTTSEDRRNARAN
jgi:hypothetical protein